MYKGRGINFNVSLFFMMLAIWLSAAVFISPVNALKSFNTLLRNISITEVDGQNFSQENKASADADIKLALIFELPSDIEDEAGLMTVAMPDGIELYKTSGQSDKGMASYEADTDHLKIELLNYSAEDYESDDAGREDSIELKGYFSEDVEAYVEDGILTVGFEEFETELEIPFAEPPEEDSESGREENRTQTEMDTIMGAADEQSYSIQPSAADINSVSAEVKNVLKQYREPKFVEVSNFEQLSKALLGLDTAADTITHIELTADITAPTTDGTTIGNSEDSALTAYQYVMGNFILDGGGQYQLNMNNASIRVSRSYDLYVYNLKIRQNFTRTEPAYRKPVFCLVGGNGSGAATDNADIHWNATFYNLDFEGSALVGAFQLDYYLYQRGFDTASFLGDTRIHVRGYGGENAVVHARNVYISGTFNMDSESYDNNVLDGATTTYFLSSAVKGAQVDAYEGTGTVSKGAFIVESGAKINISRCASKYIANPTVLDLSAGNFQSLIFGYAEYEFGEESSFNAQGGTGSFRGNPALTYTCAIIKSTDASRFEIKNGADVKLETTQASTSSTYCGMTALFLGKATATKLDFTICDGAVLDITGNGVTDGIIAAERALAPLVIMGSGASNTYINGKLNISSQTGNGWYYEYRTIETARQTFIVDGRTAEVNINAAANGPLTLEEYAAFEGYGRYEVDIQILNGAVMEVESGGYRGMSLAASDSNKSKSVKVDGEGSKLRITGREWGIAAEGQADLAISATNKGIIDIRTSGDVGDGFTTVGGAPSTIYAVGRTTILADSGGEIYIYHRGGNYAAIYQDGGPLKITVKDKGNMKVESYCTGTAYSARRAAVTVQSPSAGTLKDTAHDSYIKVSDKGTFSVRSHNIEIHDSYAFPQNRFAMGAINFGGYAGGTTGGGTIEVTNGGNFYAISDSPSPTIYLNYGSILFNDPGEFEIRNDSDEDTKPAYKQHLNERGGYNKYYDKNATWDMANVGQAVYIGYAEVPLGLWLDNAGSKSVVASFLNTDVTVWQVNKHHSRFSGGEYADAQIDTYWKSANINASIGQVVNADVPGRIVTDTTDVLRKWTTNSTGTDEKGADLTTQFALAAYGRIMGNGKSSPASSTNLLLVKEASADAVEINDEFSYTITVDNTWRSGLEGSVDDDGNIVEKNKVWKDVVLVDELDWRLEYLGCDQEGNGVTVEQSTGTDKNNKGITILTIRIDEVKASEPFKVDLRVKPNKHAEAEDILLNQAAVKGLEDLIRSNIVETEIVSTDAPDGSITKITNAKDGKSYIGSEYTYTIIVNNSDNGTAIWEGVTATDILPDELEFIRYEGSEGIAVENTGQKLEISFGDVPIGESREVIITVLVRNEAEPGKIVYNTVTTDDGQTGKDKGTEICGNGSITVEKYGVGDIPLADAGFTIERYDETMNNNEGGWVHIRWIELTDTWADDRSATSHYTQFTTLNETGDLAFTVFRNLPLGQYRIKEVASPDGYTTLPEPFIGDIPTDDEGGNPVYDITFTVYNDQILEMPMAGTGITPVTFLLLGLMLVATAARVYISVRSRRIAAETQ